MDMNLRKAILANVSGNSNDELEQTIVEAIESGEEKMLPGLGVLFEIIWEHSEEADRNEMIDILSSGVSNVE